MDEPKFSFASYNQFLTENHLMGASCKQCGAIHVPPRPMCAACHSGDMEWVELSGRGELVGYTSVYVGLTAMIEAGYSRENPYCSGVVRLVEGPAVSAQILGIDAAAPETIKIGTPLQATFVERGTGESRRTYLAFEKQG
jgi:uncharacterized OB-fold protein